MASIFKTFFEEICTCKWLTNRSIKLKHPVSREKAASLRLVETPRQKRHALHLITGDCPLFKLPLCSLPAISCPVWFPFYKKQLYTRKWLALIDRVWPSAPFTPKWNSPREPAAVHHRDAIVPVLLYPTLSPDISAASLFALYLDPVCGDRAVCKGPCPNIRARWRHPVECPPPSFHLKLRFNSPATSTCKAIGSIICFFFS